MRSDGEEILWALASAGVTVTALGLRWVVDRIRGARTISHLPEPEDRARYLARARALRRQGASLEACIEDLRRQGLRAGVARSLVMDVEREQPADTANPNDGAWRGWRFRYPGNWRLKALVPELGTDPGITVDGVGCGMFMLVALDGEHGGMDQILAEQARQVRDPVETSFAVWGSFTGAGTRYRGVHAKVRLPMELAVFRPAAADPPFAVLELHALEEADLVEPGLALIRDSFGVE